MSRPRSRILQEYAEAALIAVIFAVFVRTFVAQAFEVPTSSMATSLLAGDHILVNKLIFSDPGTLPKPMLELLPMRSVRRGDVIAFRHPRDPGRRFVKRCVGVAGDTLEIVDKTLRVNGRDVDDGAYARHVDPRLFSRSPFVEERFRHRDNFGPYTVPDGHYFVLGDNRDASSDSRFWGALPADSVIGRPFMVYWSVDEEQPETGSRDKIDPSRLTRALASTRWERSFLLIR